MPECTLKPVRVIAITGGKGGVGKTNIAINLAIELAKKSNVMLFDANLGLSNIDVLLNLDTEWNISHVLTGEKTLNDIIVNGPSGIKVIPSASGMTQLTKLSKCEIGGIIQAFSDLEDNMDILVIDTAPGISDEIVAFCRAANEVIVTVCNDPSSLTDAYALIKILNKDYGITEFHIISNMVNSTAEGNLVFTKLSIAAERFLDVTLKYIGTIPYDELLKQSTQKREVLINSYPSSPSAIAFKNICKKINNLPLITSPRGHMEFFFERLYYQPMQLESI